MKIIFMGTPEISVPFLDFCNEMGAELLVFTQKDKVRARGKRLEPTPVKKRASELNIPIFTLFAKSNEALKIMGEFAPDIIFVVAYGQILPQQILDLPRLYPLNLHFSLLPKYRGATPVNSAILNGETETGTTLTIMDKGLDSGDIALQERCEISKEDNATTLFQKLTDLSLKMLKNNWRQIETGEIKGKKQQGDPIFTKLIQKSDLWLDFNLGAVELFNKIRALTFEPGVKTIFRGDILAIEKAELTEKSSATPGEIFEISKDAIWIACKNGGLKLIQLKPAGKKSMKSSEFINGYKPQLKEKLGK